MIPTGLDVRDVGVLALLDFLLGLSLDEVARRYRLTRTVAEDELRAVLIAYGFDARGTGR
jgi:hypothetical protein